jgi:hypothetical protein
MMRHPPHPASAMAKPTGSRLVIYAALAGNLAIAIA